MAKSSATSAKKDREKRKQKDRKDKLEKKAERKATKTKSFDEMIAYVDEYGRFSSTPPSQRTHFDQESIEVSTTRQEAQPDLHVKSGVVKSFDESKGFGFIKDTNTQESIFVHVTALTTPVRQGDKVTFEVKKGDRGLFAANVKRVV
jgi:cold shock CspA family protein